MREIAIYSAIGLWGVVLLCLSVVTIRYRITARWLVISWMGLPVRWLRLTNIGQITVQRRFWVERWHNSLSPGNRYLLLEKKFGLLCRHLAITPRNHLIFKAELEAARQHRLNAIAAASRDAPTEMPRTSAPSPTSR
ncbi:MAG: hypothetical protein JXQ71_06285 [Verrucomicrobia bacterium]|nr:hypothetical protein [Verrucomicrobiota bacterium]